MQIILSNLLFNVKSKLIGPTVGSKSLCFYELKTGRNEITKSLNRTLLLINFSQEKGNKQQRVPIMTS